MHLANNINITLSDLSRCTNIALMNIRALNYFKDKNQ